MTRNMEETSAEQRLLQSCEILFGSDLTISSAFLDYLQLTGLKTAYRKRVMETHPDRVFRKDREVRQRSSLSFQRVRDAYEILLRFLEYRDRSPYVPRYHPFEKRSDSPQHPAAGPTETRKRHKTPSRENHVRKIRPIVIPDGTSRNTASSNIESFYQGAMPPRILLFGHFLYYSGLTNWRTISRVLIWQRIERPRLGELGYRFGMLCHDDIATILQRKEPLYPFGAMALKMGILDENQLRTLISHQQRLQKKFGKILVEKNLVEQMELQMLLRDFRKHNAEFATAVDYKKSQRI
jgi:hypothetical protein